jgi:hypothetical protein
LSLDRRSGDETFIALGDELTQLEAEISRLRLKLEQALRERDHVAWHLASLTRDQGAA